MPDPQDKEDKLLAKIFREMWEPIDRAFIEQHSRQPVPSLVETLVRPTPRWCDPKLFVSIETARLWLEEHGWHVLGVVNAGPTKTLVIQEAWTGYPQASRVGDDDQ